MTDLATDKVIVCDDEHCNKSKDNDTNHWSVAVMIGETIIISPNRDLLPQFLQSYPEEWIHDFCGDEHLMKWVSRSRASLIPVKR